MPRIGLSADLAAALAVWRAQPLLPIASLVLGVLAAGADNGLLGVVQLVVLLALLAWPCAERVWYLRCWSGASTSLRLAFAANSEYWTVFFRLGVLVLVPFVAASVVLAGVVGLGLGVDAFPDDDSSVPWLLVGPALLLGFLLDVRLTYVVPALVLSARGAREAWRIGGRLLRRSWPACAPYALVPPLVLSVAADWQGLGLLGDGLVVATALFATLVRGAIVASYVRLALAAGVPVRLPDGLRPPADQL